MEQKTERNGRETEAADAPLMARICWYYFKEGQTQEEIAQRLGLTRKRINRILSDARASGFVQITINSSGSACAGLETQPRRKVRPAPRHRGALRRSRIAMSAPSWAPRPANTSPTISREGGSLGITWGGTINAAAQSVLRRQGQRNAVVLLCGGLAKSTSVNPYDNAAMFARALDATCYYVTAPMYRRDEGAARRARRQRAGAQHSENDGAARYRAAQRRRSLDAIQGARIWRVLARAVALAARCRGRRRHLRPLSWTRTASPSPTRSPRAPSIRRSMNCARVPDLVLAAGGQHKVPIIRAALLAKLCHVLITDETAAALLTENTG